jgi:hypothetical protein
MQAAVGAGTRDRTEPSTAGIEADEQLVARR